MTIGVHIFVITQGELSMIKITDSDSYGIKRLESKNAKNAIIQKLATDFNLTPIIAEAYYQQFSHYFNEHANISLSSGEISYEAVSADEPSLTTGLQDLEDIVSKE